MATSANQLVKNIAKSWGVSLLTGNQILSYCLPNASESLHNILMKLNCDLGEGMPLDEQVMPYIDMANIACGFHASDPLLMAKTVKLSKSHKVQIGAHPSYDDSEGFGRREMNLSEEEITQLVLYQIGALQSLCEAQNTQVDYVKPHGALYNTMMKNETVFIAILKALSSLKQKLSLMVLANNNAEAYQQLADQYAVPLLFEAFADRAYADDGNLLPRNLEGAVLEDNDAIRLQIKRLIMHNEIISYSGKVLSIHADTLCVHGDNTQALASVKSIRNLINSID